METDSLPTAETKQPKLRWYQPTPGRLLLVLLAVEAVLLLSERCQWFAFNEKKGWTVLIAIASIVVGIVLMLLWFVLALLVHWRFQYSLRTLLLLVAVVAILCSWLATETQQARNQSEAVKAIRRLGGEVVRDCDTHDYSLTSTPPEPEWLRELLGGDFFENVVIVYINAPQATDADLEHVRGLTHLQCLYVVRMQVTDAGLKYLEELRELQELHLDNAQVTDLGLEYLKGATQLERLHIAGTHVTDEGVKELQLALPNCEIYR
jgi:hypothetical protein